MDIVRRLTAVLAIVGAVMPTVCFSETVYLKEMPKEARSLSVRSSTSTMGNARRVKSKKSRAAAAKELFRVKCVV